MNEKKIKVKYIGHSTYEFDVGQIVEAGFLRNDPNGDWYAIRSRDGEEYAFPRNLFIVLDDDATEHDIVAFPKNTDEKIETERLIMRRLMPEDYLAMASWDMDMRVYKYLLGNACKSPLEPLVWLPKKDPNSKVNILMLVIDKSDRTAIGIYALNHDLERDVWTLSYVNRYDKWGKGYTTEGMKALMNHAVKEYGARTFEGECAKENTGSARVMQKLGMTYDRSSSYTKNDGSATFESDIYVLKVGEN